jgi:hypothetical protein
LKKKTRVNNLAPWRSKRIPVVSSAVPSFRHKLVGGDLSILKNMKVSWEGLIIPYIMENKTCMKPPSSKYSSASPKRAVNSAIGSDVHRVYPIPWRKTPEIYQVPSGELTWLWKDPPFLMGKSTINSHFPMLC